MVIVRKIRENNAYRKINRILPRYLFRYAIDVKLKGILKILHISESFLTSKLIVRIMKAWMDKIYTI